MKCSATECELPATVKVIKKSVLGDVTFYMCDWHHDILGPHQRAEPLPDVGKEVVSP